MASTVVNTRTAEDQRAFLQRRVASFGAVTAVILAVGSLFRVSFVLATGKLEELFDSIFWFHSLAIACFAFTWLVCHRGVRSTRFVRTAEAIGIIGGTIGLSAMTLYIPPISSPHMVLLFTFFTILVARAVWVPGTARQTLLYGIAIEPLLLATVYLQFSRADPSSPFFYLSWSPHRAGWILMIVASCYWVIVVALCTGAAHVVYGLRKQARDIRRLGQYELIEKIGEGGMGIVYRARHAMLRRDTAVKLLLAERAGEDSVARFEQEVQLTAKLSHPNTVTIFDYGRTPDGIFYYAMELLRGATLAEVVELQGPQPASRVLKVLAETAGALNEAHQLGLIHRDIKPANIMLCEQGGVTDVTKVLDFGLVKDLEQSREVALTAAGTVTGTPQYMSPESITDPETVGPRSDLYSLAAVGYYLLTGEHLFTGENVMKVCAQHISEQPVPPSERLGAEVPGDLEALLLRCLAKAPEQRPASARELQRELERCADFGDWDGGWWWEEFGPALERTPSEATGVGATLEIDLARRRAAKGR